MPKKRYVELTICQTRSCKTPGFRKQRHTSPGDMCHCSITRALCFTTFVSVISLSFQQKKNVCVWKQEKHFWVLDLTVRD